MSDPTVTSLARAGFATAKAQAPGAVVACNWYQYAGATYSTATGTTSAPPAQPVDVVIYDREQTKDDQGTQFEKAKAIVLAADLDADITLSDYFTEPDGTRWTLDKVKPDVTGSVIECEVRG